MKPLVSICCITYNHEKYIEKTLKNFISQRTDFDFEVLIHDDASTDSTVNIIKKYVDMYPDIIKPIFQSENQYSKGIINISERFNFIRAEGRYIAMCEGDDYWMDNDKLQKQFDYMEKHEYCFLCLHSAKMVNDSGALIKGMLRPYKRTREITPEEIIDKTVGYPTASLFFKSEVIKNIPEYYSNCPIGDIPLQLMCAEHGYAYYFDKPMCVYRFAVVGSWTQSMLEGDFKKKQEAYAKDMKEMYKAFDEHTQRRFHSTVIDAYRRLYYRTRVNIKDWDIIFSERHRKYLSELGYRDMFFLIFERKFPGIYRSLQKSWQKKTTF